MKTKLTDKETLAYLGTNAQYSIVKSLVEDTTLFKQTAEYLNPYAFTEKPLSVIIKLMTDAYNQNGVTLNYRELGYKLKDKAKDDAEYESFRKAIMTLQDEKTDNGRAVATEIGIRHLKTLEMQRVLSNGLINLKNGGYTEDKMNSTVSQLQDIEKIKVAEDSLTAEELFDMVLSSTAAERVPTGIDAIDKAMNGGLPKGSLGLIIAGTGVGKTTFGSIMTIRMALAGKRVAHIFFEDKLPQIGAKYYAHLTGRWTIEYQNATEEKKKVLAREIMGNKEYREALNRIKPKRMRNGEDRIEDIINHIRHLITSGFKPDAVIIDYLSCVKLTSNQDLAANKEWELLEKGMKKLECFAQDEDIAIWVEQQTNRNGCQALTKNDRIGNVQGSFRVTQPASFIFYLERSDTDKANLANLYMDKCRECEPTAWLDFAMNNGNCQIDMTEDQPSCGLNPDKLFAQGQ